MTTPVAPTLVQPILVRSFGDPALFWQYGLMAPSGFLPSQLAGLVAWYKADSLTANDGDLIATWADQSGNGNTLTQATDAAKPVYKVNVQNGQPVLRFDGVDDWMTTTASFAGETGLEVFCVGARTGTPAFGMMVVTFRGGNELRWAGDGATIEWLYNGNSVDGAVVSGWHLYEGDFDGANKNLRVDNGAAASSANAAGLSDSVIDIGARNGTNFFAGDIGEIVVTNQSQTAANNALMHTYATGRWGTP